jgi:hypothetical protein
MIGYKSLFLIITQLLECSGQLYAIFFNPASAVHLGTDEGILSCMSTLKKGKFCN